MHTFTFNTGPGRSRDPQLFFTFKLKLDALLDAISEDEFDLVFGSSHVGAIRVVSCQVDGVEFALGGADSAADALVLINKGRAALEASSGLSLDLFFGEYKLGISEGSCACLTEVNAGDLSLGVVIGLNFDVFFVEFDELVLSGPCQLQV